MDQLLLDLDDLFVRDLAQKPDEVIADHGGRRTLVKLQDQVLQHALSFVGFCQQFAHLASVLLDFQSLAGGSNCGR